MSSLPKIKLRTDQLTVEEEINSIKEKIKEIEKEQKGEIER